MKKIVGYCEMVKKHGKIVFVVDDKPPKNVVGSCVDKVYVYDADADNINPESIGKSITLEKTSSVNIK